MLMAGVLLLSFLYLQILLLLRRGHGCRLVSISMISLQRPEMQSRQLIRYRTLNTNVGAFEY